MADETVRLIRPSDEDAIWEMLRPVFRAGETYTVDPDISRENALDYWCGGHEVFAVEDSGGRLLGTYFICPNQKGGGAHVCNCGFVTSVDARGKGIARLMLAHSLERAVQRGFRAMQFNFVVSTNKRAIDIWQRHGFDVAGRLPGAFRHPVEGYVDALVMYRDLTAWPE